MTSVKTCFCKFEKINEFTLDNPVKEDPDSTHKDFVEDKFSIDDLIETLESVERLDNNSFDSLINNADYLTNLQKQVLTLVIKQDKSFGEAGNEMEIKKQTAHEQYHAALKKLRKTIKPKK